MISPAPTVSCAALRERLGMTSTTTRERLLGSARTLFQRQGFAATGIKQILEVSDAASASLYHFYPGGKHDLAADAIRTSGAEYQALVESVLDSAPDPCAGVRACFDGAASTVEASGYQDACPIATVASEIANTDDELRQACADVFDSWIDAAAKRFRAAGVKPAAARELAVTFIMLLEGGFLMARVRRDAAPLRRAGRTMEALVRASLDS